MLTTFKPSLLPSAPTIRCHALPTFDANNLDEVRAAFSAGQPCPLGQAWRAKLDPKFAPGKVWAGWRKDSLLVFAELADNDIYTHAKSTNQRMWMLGDTFEMFLRPDGQEEYVELHVAPNNHRLQLRFTDAEACRTKEFSEMLLAEDAFHSVTWVQPETCKWFVYAEIPASVFSHHAALPSGMCWHFSFCRYDYTRGESDPVISSTSPHTVANFHNQQDWGQLTFA